LPPGSDGDPIGAWRRAGLDLALSRGQLPSQQTAASADAAGVLLVIDPPPIGSGPDEEAQVAHQQEALRLIGSHASAAVLLQRGEGLLRSRDDVGARASEEPYVLATTERAQIEAARRAKFQPQTALVLEGLPNLEEGEGALATTAALGSWTHVDGGGLRLRFHVVNDERSVFGRAVLRWRLSAPGGGWAPLRRDRHGEVDVILPASDEPPVVIEVDVSPPAGDVLVLEVELDKDGETMSRLSYRLDE
jgi:hypothetical protein